MFDNTQWCPIVATSNAALPRGTFCLCAQVINRSNQKNAKDTVLDIRYHCNMS